MSARIRSLYFVPMVMALAMPLHAASWVVSPSKGQFADIASALSASRPGDTVIVRTGNYTLRAPLRLDKANVRLTGVAGERVLITADNKLAAAVIIVADGVALSDLMIQGGFYGIKIDVDGAASTRNVSISNCQIGSTGADCIKSFNADALRIEACRIGPSGLKQKDNAEGIDAIGSLGITIRNCLIEDISTNGIYLKGGTRDGVIEKCLIRRCGSGGILLGQDTDEEFMREGRKNEAIHCVARNNIIIDTSSAGMGTYSGKDVQFVNNTLLDVARDSQAGFWVVTNGREVPAENVLFQNNILVVAGDRPAMFIKDAVGLPKSQSNVFLSRRGPVRFVREMSADGSQNHQWTLAQWQQATGQDTQSIEDDPRLDARQYHPVPGSPAIGTGEVIQGIQDDYFGHRRPSPGWDIGAVAAGK